jgi:phosphoribosylformylglycinamidine synthase
VAITNCLNFGNPEKPPIMWQFVEAVEGMAEACRAMNTPVTGGNVSFYNETSGNAVHPTPAVGMVGLLEDAGKAVGSSFIAEGDEIVLLGETREDLGGSEYLAHVHGIEAGRTPEPDFEGEAALCRLLVEGAREGLLRSAHDCAEGGLAVTALESCFRPEHVGSPLGCEIDLGPEGDLRDDALLFGETPGRVLASCLPQDADRLIDTAARHGVPAVRCGSVCSGRLTLKREGEVLVDRDTAPLYRAWREAFDRLAEGD